jgi:hypothetical protein
VPAYKRQARCCRYCTSGGRRSFQVCGWCAAGAHTRARQKSLWKLLVDMSLVCVRVRNDIISYRCATCSSLQEELVKSAMFWYITDVITPDEALAMLKAKEATKDQRETIVRSRGCVWCWDTACQPFSSTQSQRYPPT